MGSTSVLVIGDAPIDQLMKFTDADSAGGHHWNDLICTLDLLPLKTGAVGQVAAGDPVHDESAFTDIPSGKAGRARKEAIDLEALRDAAGDAAAQAWDGAVAARGGPPGESFDDACARCGGLQALLALYRTRPATDALLTRWRGGSADAAEWLSLPRQELVDAARADALLDAYGQVVHDGVLLIDTSEEAWMRQAARGPSSLAERKRTLDAWHAEFNARLDALPGHTLLTSTLVKV